MSTLQEEITRIANDKEAIKAAIEEKGVEVGDASLDDYAGLIEQITAGGGATTFGTVYYTDSGEAKTLPIDLDGFFNLCEKIEPYGMMGAGYNVTISGVTIPKSSITKVVIENTDSIPSYFLSGDSGSYSRYTSLTEVVIPDNVKTIGDKFLYYALSCTSVNIPSALTGVGEYFLAYTGIEGSLTVPNGITKLPNYFCQYCPNLEQITLHNGITEIGDHVFSSLGNYNGVFIIPNSVTTIGSYFFGGSYQFNHPVTIPDSVQSIGVNFMTGMTAFNSTLTLSSSLTSIPSYFLSSSSAFNQPLTIPSNITSVGASFMSMCDNFTGPLTIETTAYPNDQYVTYKSLSTYNEDAPMYTEGVQLTGAGAQAWKDNLPNSDTNPYRKLVYGQSD